MVLGNCKIKSLLIHDHAGKLVASISDAEVKVPQDWKVSAILEESATGDCLMTLTPDQIFKLCMKFKNQKDDLQ